MSGCAGGQPIGSPDIAAYALAHRSLPDDLLRRAGLPPVYRKMPFICGTPTVAAEEELRRTVASLPKEQQERILAEYHQSLKDMPPPEPEYVVNLAQVEAVTVSWLGGTKVVVLRHPVKLGSTAGVWHHPLPPARITFQGPSLAGAGPVTVWLNGKFLYFSDEPWMLVQAGKGGFPFLLSMQDNFGAGGPIEMSIAKSPMDPHALGGEFFCFLDTDAAGGHFELIPQQAAAASAAEIRVMWILDGVERNYGVLRFDGKEGDCLVPAEAPGTAKD